MASRGKKTTPIQTSKLNLQLHSVFMSFSNNLPKLPRLQYPIQIRSSKCPKLTELSHAHSLFRITTIRTQSQNPQL
ncbi:unnamed protein product [Cuscuta campestris]|uniref:Uncharacterized protein n=1 Tax=Cuscuta campestris TaxID=132261 RepID=A0A484LVN6_9ASTE|nr:unnamed protein product [Cuscuta campestris]